MELSSVRNGKDFDERHSFNLGACIYGWACCRSSGKGFLVASDLLVGQAITTAGL